MEVPTSFLKGSDLHFNTNKTQHHTNEITDKRLIVRRGQHFLLTIKLKEPFKPDNPLLFTAKTGSHPKEELGTMSFFSVPEKPPSSPNAKAVWRASLQSSSPVIKGILILTITPPADCPIGKYELLIKYKGDEIHLADVVVLFNPWCPDDSVFMSSDKKRKEYVLNESGVVYRGSANYIMPLPWDFGQFEENMVDIGILLLDKSLSYDADPENEVASRCDPIHVGRVLSAMINSEDDPGVLQGNWSGDYTGGFSPSHWNGSHDILQMWFESHCKPVKYGQCWVFACVMCSAMRLLGIPCRVVTNFSSAHDTDRNLTIDTYHTKAGIEERQSPDSVWNFHVWVEGWLKRPDLEGDFDGWQVFDPTPQETSGGVYRCGPASVKAIKRGCTDLKYDVPFVFAEVNADCVDWLVTGEGENEILKVTTDKRRVGKYISTKTVGSKERRDITEYYKHEEGSSKERQVFFCAVTRDYAKADHVEDVDSDNTDIESDDGHSDDEETETPPEEETPPPKLKLRFEEVTQPINGNDVSLNLVVHSESDVPREFKVNITAQAMRYNGVPVNTIMREESMQTLLPGKDLLIPVNVPYKDYHKDMIDCESMKIDAVLSEKDLPDNNYLAESDVVLFNPEITLDIPNDARKGFQTMAEMTFINPLEETLKNCTLTVTGSGLLLKDQCYRLPDLDKDTKVRVKLFFYPLKLGDRSLVVDFDCSEFRDIKASRTITVI